MEFDLETAMNNLEGLRPQEKPNVIDLVAQAGIDVSDWSNWKRGNENPGGNPKYCYEWCFEQEGMYVFNLWHGNSTLEGGRIIQKLNVRETIKNVKGPAVARAKKFDDALSACFQSNSNPRVILLDRPGENHNSATARSLDPSPWTVVTYDYASGTCVLERGVVQRSISEEVDVELAQFTEGTPRERMTVHRRREAKLREEKISTHLLRNDGALICEVPNCGFDFRKVYGELGAGFAHVHHLTPLSETTPCGTMNTIEDLAVVCANCHAMIHRGGECRSIETLILVKD